MFLQKLADNWKERNLTGPSMNNHWYWLYLFEVYNDPIHVDAILMADLETCLQRGADINIDEGKPIKYACEAKNLKLFYLFVAYGADYKCLQARGYLEELGINVDQVESREQLIRWLDILLIHQE